MKTSQDKDNVLEEIPPVEKVAAEETVETSEAVSTVTELTTLRQERDELRNQLLRKRADFENYRKRVERDRQQVGNDAAADLLKNLIPILDSLEEALKAEGTAASFKTGVELIYRDFFTRLEGQGVTSQDPVGQKFDPQNHQALSHEWVAGFEEGTVVEVFRKGYLFKERLLRPAFVKVAKSQDQEKIEENDSNLTKH